MEDRSGSSGWFRNKPGVGARHASPLHPGYCPISLITTNGAFRKTSRLLSSPINVVTTVAATVSPMSGITSSRKVSSKRKVMSAQPAAAASNTPVSPASAPKAKYSVTRICPTCFARAPSVLSNTLSLRRWYREVVIAPTSTIVPARIADLNGRPVDELLSDTTRARRARWPLTREYRNTYRDTLVRTETLVAGQWWGDRQAAEARSLPRISVEEDVAAELRVGLGDTITWDFQGVLIETEIASLRRVNWGRFEPNFFVVFEPGVLEDAPQSFLTLIQASDVTVRAELQRDLVQRYPNILAIDLSLIQETLDTIIGSVTAAIRFMALFTIVSGTIVLLGAITTSRYQRLRESVLLKTLGARAKQIGQILVTEYFALGALAGLTGVLLAAAAGWALITFLFELTFQLEMMPLIGLTVVATVVTTLIGLLSSREVFRKAPLVVMREMGE